MSHSESLYQKLPLFLQDFLVNTKGFFLKHTRYNSNFRKELKNYIENYKTNKIAVDHEQLRGFLFAAKTSRYWNSTFEKYNINLNSEDVVSEIVKLPILSKDEVFNNYNDLITKEKGKKHYLATGGTTGQRLEIPAFLNAINKQWAIWWRYRYLHGITAKTWCGWFGGKQIVQAQQNEPPYWRINYPGRQIMFSPIHLSLKTAKHYYVQIKKRKLTWLHGYPSQISLLASYILELNLPPIDSVKIITTGAEALLDYQKEIIQKAFNAKITEHYGLTEGVANISIWPDNEYHVDSDFCFVEFVPLDKKNPTICKIIGTNYSNPVFPLIRYDTGDIAEIEWKNGTPKIKSIEGRREDYITLPNGNRFGPMNLIFKEFKNIKEAQLIISRSNLLVFHLVKNEKFNSKNEDKIIKTIEERLSDDNVKFKLEYVNRVIRTESGKIKSVIKNQKP